MRDRTPCSRGFTLLEVLVASAALVLAAAAFGAVVQNAIRQRIEADNLAAATALATLQAERLLSLAGGPDLEPGEYGPFLVDVGGTETVTGPFEVRWSVSERPLPIDFPRARRIRVSARHAVDPGARCEIETTLAVP